MNTLLRITAMNSFLFHFPFPYRSTIYQLVSFRRFLGRQHRWLRSGYSPGLLIYGSPFLQQLNRLVADIPLTFGAK